ncbi:MAG: DUF1343 domain-containing protein [Chitinophagaceae bacterium]|nr:DUF1343 domain-containing protein [Chitinophagaceae bacterium]
MRTLILSFFLLSQLTAKWAIAKTGNAPDTGAVPAIERLENYFHLLRNKKLGLVANHSSQIGGRRSLDVLRQRGARVVRLFGPEHGWNGATSAAREVENAVDPATGLRVVSLFGKNYKPAASDLKGIDLMLFDMQDVGVRFYTYISTLHYVMEACAEQGIPLIVFDRPNPNDGYIDGPVLKPGYESFIGMHPVPVVYGLTIGEYAQMINGEKWLKNGIKCKLTVIPLDGYRHGDSYRFTVPPSPNLGSLQAIKLYPSLCWFGATAISDGRGTDYPFEAIGAPVLKNEFVYNFVPRSIKGKSEQPKYLGDTCYGLDLRAYPLTSFGIGGGLQLDWLTQFYKVYPDKAGFFITSTANPQTGILHFDYLAGDDQLRQQVTAGYSAADIKESWQPALADFRKRRSSYLLYPDAPESVSILSYNIHHGADKNEVNTLDSMAAFIRQSGAGIVCLQEVDSVCQRSGSVDQTEMLAKAAGMKGVFARHFPFEEGAYGISILSRYEIINATVYRLPIDSSAQHKTVAFLMADIRISGNQIITVAVVHMDYRSQSSRIRQAGEIIRLLHNTPHPVMLAGDMNGSPTAAEIGVLTQYLREEATDPLYTFPAEAPNRKIDYILLGNGIRSVGYKTDAVLYSDHLPLLRRVVFEKE